MNSIEIKADALIHDYANNYLFSIFTFFPLNFDCAKISTPTVSFKGILCGEVEAPIQSDSPYICNFKIQFLHLSCLYCQIQILIRCKQATICKIANTVCANVHTDLLVVSELS